MTRHEVMQLKVKSKVMVNSGMYAGKVGVIEYIDLSASYPNGSLVVNVEGSAVKLSGTEISRHTNEEEKLLDETMVDVTDEVEEEDEFSYDPLDYDDEESFDEGEIL